MKGIRPALASTAELAVRVRELAKTLGRDDVPPVDAPYDVLEKYWNSQLLEEVGCILSSSE